MLKCEWNGGVPVAVVIRMVVRRVVGVAVPVTVSWVMPVIRGMVVTATIPIAIRPRDRDRVSVRRRTVHRTVGGRDVPAARVTAATPWRGHGRSAACSAVRATASAAATMATLRAGRACRNQAKSKSGWNCHLDELHDRLHRVAPCTPGATHDLHFCKHFANLSISKRL